MKKIDGWLTLNLKTFLKHYSPVIVGCRWNLLKNFDFLSDYNGPNVCSNKRNLKSKQISVWITDELFSAAIGKSDIYKVNRARHTYLAATAVGTSPQPAEHRGRNFLHHGLKIDRISLRERDRGGAGPGSSASWNFY